MFLILLWLICTCKCINVEELFRMNITNSFDLKNIAYSNGQIREDVATFEYNKLLYVVEDQHNLALSVGYKKCNELSLKYPAMIEIKNINIIHNKLYNLLGSTIKFNLTNPTDTDNGCKFNMLYYDDLYVSLIDGHLELSKNDKMGFMFNGKDLYIPSVSKYICIEDELYNICTYANELQVFQYKHIEREYNYGYFPYGYNDMVTSISKAEYKIPNLSSMFGTKFDKICFNICLGKYTHCIGFCFSLLFNIF